MTGTVSSIVLAGTPEAPRLARAWVEETAVQNGWTGPLDDMVLMVSELVTNVLHHTRDHVGITLYLHDQGLYVSVSDDGTGKVLLHHALPTDTSGRGVELLDRMSDAWGVSEERVGKSVWFELTGTTATTR